MKKKIIAILIWSLSLAFSLLLTGCTTEKLSTEKLRDIDFTVVDKEDIPEEFKKIIDAKGKESFRLSFADGNSLYIAVGYGEQPTTGYSIQVTELYESKNAIYIHTNVIGPSKDEKVLERKTHPFIVVKMENMDKNVVFE